MKIIATAIAYDEAGELVDGVESVVEMPEQVDALRQLDEIVWALDIKLNGRIFQQITVRLIVDNGQIVKRPER